MILIVGLGNPGEKYEKTKHNLGFAVLDTLLQKLTPLEKTEWRENKKFNSLVAKVNELILAKPQTLMNASGFAVAKMAHFYKIEPEDIWVIHDDVDLPLEKIRVVQGRGAAGHRGVESIIKELGTIDFVRFRLGIGHPGLESSDQEVESYVLASFGRGEKSKARRMVEKTVKAIQLALEEGLERATHQIQS
jgi:PTH1 family peptidyl-tRNA hydrolase